MLFWKLFSVRSLNFWNLSIFTFILLLKEINIYLKKIWILFQHLLFNWWTHGQFLKILQLKPAEVFIQVCSGNTLWWWLVPSACRTSWQAADIKLCLSVFLRYWCFLKGSFTYISSFQRVKLWAKETLYCWSFI